MRRSDFAYDLPQELIAQRPAEPRSASRLLCLEADGPADRQMTDFPTLLDPRDLVVFNDTRVIPARLFGRKETGGAVELLVERVIDEQTLLAQLGVSKKPKAGSRILIDGTASALIVEGREDEFFRLRLESEGRVQELLACAGRLPLPPYITHAPDAADASRYQTVFAAKPGAVAAPTAGLHFDEALLAAIAARGVRSATVTLHVGAGTFQPLRVETLAEHRMHAEVYEIPPGLADAITATRQRGGRVVAVGTTVVRTLESAAAAPQGLAAHRTETRLFITPGYRFQVVDALLTNFHLPESTLLMLVAAFAGFEQTLAAYRHAVERRYRFFSYGDAMWIPAARRTASGEEHRFSN